MIDSLFLYTPHHWRPTLARLSFSCARICVVRSSFKSMLSKFEQ